SARVRKCLAVEARLALQIVDCDVSVVPTELRPDAEAPGQLDHPILGEPSLGRGTGLPKVDATGARIAVEVVFSEQTLRGEAPIDGRSRDSTLRRLFLGALWQVELDDDDAVAHERFSLVLLDAWTAYIRWEAGQAFRLWRHGRCPGGLRPLERSESPMISIVGTWRLVRAEAFDTNGTPQPAPYGGAAIGRVMFTSSGRMMAMTGDGRPSHAGQVREYNSYAGTYTFNGKRLITRVDCCSNPA